MRKYLYGLMIMMVSPLVLKAQQELISTQQPVPRNHNRYNWMERHNKVKERIRATNPQAIIFANSIIHLWGGEPVADTFTRRGPETWAKYMEPKRVQNAGFGSDRIANVLWRVYHGELDDFNGKKIMVDIGTNDVPRTTDDEIVAGLEFLLQQIRIRKPEADVILLGILPRRKREARVLALNEKIRKMAEAGHFRFADFSEYFLTGDKLNESLFVDGLHPNESGYEILGRQLQQLL